MSNARYAAHWAADPYFELVRGALGDLVDGGHYFDVFADDAEFEVRYEFPGWPRIVHGRDNLISQFAGYGSVIRLQAADHLLVHRAESDQQGNQTVILEYDVHGTIIATGKPYSNRFASVITIANRKIVHWRDYMDSLAAWNALMK